jgi:predicted protein tyrosine phosphatase
LISINEEYEPLYPLKLDRESENVLTLRFTDITAPLTHEGEMYHPISAEDAFKILKFIDKHLTKDFIVHCAAGVSRSSAICLYLHIMHSYVLKDNFWLSSSPNCYVLGMLMRRKVEQESMLDEI